MQPQLFARNVIAFCMLSIIPAVHVISQHHSNDSVDELKLSMHRIKPVMLNWLSPDRPVHSSASTSKTLNRINIKAVRSFKKRYGEQVNEKWISSNQGYLVVFTSNGVLTRVRYTYAGRWINTMKQFSEQAMSKELRENVKEAFENSTILVIYEFVTSLRREKISYVHLKHENKYKILKAVDNKIEDIQVMNL
jgi:hypothetical protein